MCFQALAVHVGAHRGTEILGYDSEKLSGALALVCLRMYSTIATENYYLPVLL